MIILDTNVVSELMKPNPADRVIRFVASQTATSLYTTSITYAEILHGILLLPAGKRRKNFEQAAEMMFDEDFAGRILPFGSDGAFFYAEVATERQRRGRPIFSIRRTDCGPRAGDGPLRQPATCRTSITAASLSSILGIKAGVA
jgi:predicted nucleic acid-binding protein